MYLKIRFLIILILTSTIAFSQDTNWIKKQINEILTLNLPSKFQYSQESFVKHYYGYVNSNLYAFQFYDSVVNEIKTERQFQISLAGFMEGKIHDPVLKNYYPSYFDTTIGGTRGAMVKYKAVSPLEKYPQIFLYGTIANSRFYFFYIYSKSFKENNEEVNKYFNSIMFQSKLIKENAFVTKALLSKDSK